MPSILTAVFVIASLAASNEVIPQIVRSHIADVPIWTSARAAQTPDGSLSPLLVGDGTRYAIQYGRVTGATAKSQARQDAGSVATLCKQTWSEPTGDFESAEGRDNEGVREGSSLARLAENAYGVYEGEVTAAQFGFAYREPGTLASIDVRRVIKSYSALRPSNRLLIFHDYARFAVGIYAFCIGQRPLVAGDRVLIFILRPPLEGDVQVLSVSDGLFIAHGDHVYAPATSITLGNETAGMTLQDVREHASKVMRHER